MNQSLYPASNVVGGIVHFVVDRTENFIEGLPPPLDFDRIVAIGLNQFIRRRWIVVFVEHFIKVAKHPARFIAYRFGFASPVTCLREFPLTLAPFFVISLFVSCVFVICHPSI